MNYAGNDVDDSQKRSLMIRLRMHSLGEVINTIDAAETSWRSTDKPLSDFNRVTQRLADYIAKDVAHDRTVVGGSRSNPGGRQNE